MSQAIHTDQAPAAIGPYVQARKVTLTGQLLFTSGQIALDPKDGSLVGEGDVEAQTHQCLANLAAILQEAGGAPGNVVKTTVFIKDMNDFGKINAIYADFFGDHKPARSCVEVARLPKDVLVEIEAIAQL